jgi:HAD superfamily hydrolase (TIGR01509 family)
MIGALLWDVDGTLAETERDGHRVAFNRAFEGEGLPWRWDVDHYGELLKVTGGVERMLHHMQGRTDVPASTTAREDLARRLHGRKNAHYAQLMRTQGIALREGVRELIDECRARGVQLAIVTTTSRANVEVLLGHHLGPAWATWFATVVCGEDVRAKKPAPDAYHLALRVLALAPSSCVAIEDSPAGVAAARAADVPVVVTRSVYFAHDAIDGVIDGVIEGVIAVGPGLHRRDGWSPALDDADLTRSAARVTLDDIAAWQGIGVNRDGARRHGG